ncbi:MAG: hypothetical protein AUH79_04660 [Betaproteobacteria bacterium 13_1_40CM_4_64_4]|nr:MAG: hypothetical protein AUH79_04660 [Betaproteobacteria bacterium 13_1_40CM_4_64_4]
MALSLDADIRKQPNVSRRPNRDKAPRPARGAAASDEHEFPEIRKLLGERLPEAQDRGLDPHIPGFP